MAIPISHIHAQTFNAHAGLDGLLQSGRPLDLYRSGNGPNGRLFADVRVDWGWFRVRANPMLFGASPYEGGAFPIGGLNSGQLAEYRKRFSWIDDPERYGAEARTWVHPGASEIRIGPDPIGFGVSSRSQAWGAGQRQHLLWSDRPLGFLHGFVELDRVPIGIGRVSLMVVGGRLDSSGHARYPMPDEWRWFSGLNASVEPRFLKGLEVGLIRIFVKNGSQLDSWTDYVPFLEPFEKAKLGEGTDGTGSQPDNQLASVYFRWSLSEGDVLVYGEYARDDHSIDLRDLTLEPDHMRAYVWGISGRVGAGRLGMELTDLLQANSRKLRASGWWYTNAGVRHGHTHLGQVLGAEIGPGSRSQEVWWESDRARLSLRRVDVDKDLYHAAFTGLGYRPEVDWILRAGRDWSTERWIWSVDASWRHTRNRFYIQGKHESSLGLGFGARYRIR